MVSEASVRFSMLQTGSFSAQVKNVFTFDVIVSATLTLFPPELYIYEVVNNETILFFLSCLNYSMNYKHKQSQCFSELLYFLSHFVLCCSSFNSIKSY